MKECEAFVTSREGAIRKCDGAIRGADSRATVSQNSSQHARNRSDIKGA
jgi:hypothetical protein